MILETTKLKEKCAIVLSAVDSNELSLLTETLQLKVIDNTLFMSVTNREYFAEIRLELNQCESFHATVNANLFLKLISQITTETVELSCDDNSLYVKANGNYKLPLIFDDNKLLELPEITINNVTKELDISSDILNSILQYNSKELLRGTISKPIQKMYYMDEKGAITFTSGACVNSFELNCPLRILLNARIVKLFKLFQDVIVHVNLGFDAISDDIIQTKIAFETKDIKLTAILSCDDSLLNSVPAAAIRGRAEKIYPYSITLNKTALLQTANRLLLFNSGAKEVLKPYSTLEFNTDSVTIWDVDKQNKEVVNYSNNSTITDTYTAVLDLVDLKTVLENCNEEFITLKFGDNQAFILSRSNITNIIPECRTI